MMASEWLPFDGIFFTQSTFQGLKEHEKGEKNSHPAARAADPSGPTPG